MMCLNYLWHLYDICLPEKNKAILMGYSDGRIKQGFAGVDDQIECPLWWTDATALMPYRKYRRPMGVVTCTSCEKEQAASSYREFFEIGFLHDPDNIIEVYYEHKLCPACFESIVHTKGTVDPKKGTKFHEWITRNVVFHIPPNLGLIKGLCFDISADFYSEIGSEVCIDDIKIVCNECIYKNICKKTDKEIVYKNIYMKDRSFKNRYDGFIGINFTKRCGKCRSFIDVRKNNGDCPCLIKNSNSKKKDAHHVLQKV